MSSPNPACADIIVVGAGGAGLTASLAASRLGRSVLLLEKASNIGGTTALSVGSVTASCTPQQKAAGIDDDPNGHFEDMGALAGSMADLDNLELRRLYVEQVPETVRFLIELGIEFLGPLPEPPHRKPRMHVIVPHSHGYIHHLARHCRREGVEIRTGLRVDQLLRENGRVVGVRASSENGTFEWRARRAVVLTSGDYSASPQLKHQYADPALAPIQGINPRSTGDGQRMALQVGAELVNGNIAWGPEIRFVPPLRPGLVTRIPPHRIIARAIRLAMHYLPAPLMRPFMMGFVTTYLAPSPTLFEQGAILVNSEGKRFCNERDNPELSITQQPQGNAYIILDRGLAEKFCQWPHYISTAPGVAYAYLNDYLHSRRDICHQADSPESLAAKLGIDPAGLASTLAELNTKDGRGGLPLQGESPFYGLGPVKSWILLTDGGLRVNTKLQVLDAGGAPIPGLFAAGSTGQGGLLLEGHGHHLGWAFTSGRIAGRSAAYSPLK